MFLRSRFFLLALACVLFSMSTVTIAQECSNGEGENGECANPDVVSGDGGDKNCPDRDHLMRCASKYLDTNNNGKLDRHELQGAIDKLPWLSRGVIKILGSVDKMMAKCDVDGDDAISIDYDMQNNKETCLATCFKKRAFKGAFFPDCDL